ncbi:MAG: GNAT family N-acetyltransferase [Caldimonas sp.]
MSAILVCRHRAEVLPWRDAWERGAAEQGFSFPNFDALLALVESRPGDVVVLAREAPGDHATLACFVRSAARKTWRAGERRLFSLPVREVRLFGSAVLGKVDRDIVADLLDALSAAFDFHVLTLGELRIESPLYAAATSLRQRFAVTELSRKRSLRWLIRLPADFEAYMMSLGAKSRQNIRREMRQLDKNFAARFQRVTEAAEVGPFLAAAESVSRKTYQWNVGQRIVEDEPTRRSLQELAGRGELRCYGLALDGQPCAFMRGKLAGGVYEFETAGFDPAFGKASPGAVLLLWAVRDLIEHAPCRVFDFGTGGDDVGYKARFGNESSLCAALQLGPRWHPYTRLLFALDKSLFMLLNLSDRLLGQGALRSRLKHALRKYGAG